MSAGRPERAAAQMAATAKAAPELKRLAGVSSAGRKLEKPVYHYTLAWEKTERPSAAEMSRAADESLKALGMEDRQALIVAHRDKAHPHLHVIVNRVAPETGKAASRGNDRLKLSRWAERWEREHGREGCPARARNNAERARGALVKDRASIPTGRYRRERMNPPMGRRRDHPPVGGRYAGAARKRWRGREAEAWKQYQETRREELEGWGHNFRHDWRQRYAAERQERAAVEKLAAGGVGDRLRLTRIVERGEWGKLGRSGEEKPVRGFGRLRSAWREARTMGVREAVGALRTDPGQVQRRGLEKLEKEHRTARAHLGRRHSRTAIGAEQDMAEVYEDGIREAGREAERGVAIERHQDLEAQRQQMPQQTPQQTPDRDSGRSRER